MQKKSIVLSLLLLLLVNTLVVSFTIQIGKPDPGVIHVPGDYGTISWAIGNATSGDTIIVGSGTYNEEVVISKPLTILGAGADTTIIDGNGLTLTQGSLVKITAAGDVTLSGFTIRNAPIVPSSDDLRICLLTQSSIAGPTYTISYNKIYGSNDPDEYNDYGFYASFGKENIVFTHNLVTETSNNNIVCEVHTGSTEISHNTLDAGVWGTDAVFFMTYDGQDVNTLQNVSYNTIDMSTGGPFDYDHHASGISFTSPGGAPWYPWDRLTPAKFTNMLISGNEIDNLESYRRGIGFWIGGTGAEIVSPIVTNNVINGLGNPVGSSGIDFVGSGIVTGTTITGNTITGTKTAIELRSGDASGATMNYNNIEDNTIGLNWTIGSAADARFNWWGDPTGPYYPLLNPSGLGDNIIGDVAFEPWLIASYPPATEVEALLYISPANVEYWTVSYGQTFTVGVKLDDVTNLYGFEFKVYWNTTLLDLVNVQQTPPWSSSNVGKDELREDLGRYWLGITGVSPSPPFSGNTTLARLTFKMTYDPIYPESETCQINLADTTLVGPGPLFEPIYHMEHDGKYTIYSTKPKIVVDPATYAAHALGENFTIKINVTDVVHLYEFSFQLDFNPTLLKVVSNGLQVGSFLNSPVIKQSNTDNINGHVLLWVSAGVGAPPSNGTGTLATITFQVKSASLWRLNHANILTCTLHLHDTMLKTDTGTQVAHDDIDGAYQYVPKPGDLDYDGHTGLSDLRTVGYWYAPAYNAVADLNEDGKINITDLTIVGWYYGEDC